MQTARSHALKFEKATEDAKSNPKLLGVASAYSDRDRVQMVERDNRPTLKFVDVGGKFLDVKDRNRRIKEAERRAKLREKRRLRTAEEIISSKADQIRLRMLQAQAQQRAH